MKKIILFCKSYLLKYKWLLFIYITVSVIVSLGGLVSPYIIGDFIDHLMTADGMGFIYRYFLAFAGVNITTLLLGYVSGQLYAYLQTRLGFEFNRDFIKKLQHAPSRFTDKQDAAYLNQRINNDSNSLIIFCIGIIQNILVNLVVVAVALALMFAFHPVLALILIGVTVVYFVIYVSYKRVLYRASHAFQESQSVFFSKLNEQLFSIRFIKLHSLFKHFIQRLNNSFDALLGYALWFQRANYVFSGLDKLVLISAQMILLLFGGMEIMEGRLTIGRFIIISSYFNLMLASIRYFFSLGKTVQNNMVSYNRLQEFAGIENEPNGGQLLDEVREIELKSVSFAYGERAVFEDRSFNFYRGQVTVLLGPNGAGKSTLTDIIIGLQAGNFGGQVLYNGVSMQNLDMYDVRNRLIGVSEQEPTLLADTLAANLNLDRANCLDVQRGEVDRLVKILGLESYIYNLPNRFETVINENAANISGGEKQKLSMLRALLKNPDVLILDEPTSALDASGKTSLRSHLDAIKKDKIIIVITHDSDFIDYDKDLVFYL